LERSGAYQAQQPKSQRELMTVMRQIVELVRDNQINWTKEQPQTSASEMSPPVTPRVNPPPPTNKAHWAEYAKLTKEEKRFVDEGGYTLLNPSASVYGHPKHIIRDATGRIASALIHLAGGGGSKHMICASGNEIDDKDQGMAIDGKEPISLKLNRARGQTTVERTTRTLRGAGNRSGKNLG
jgi:hypothetical protein